MPDFPDDQLEFRQCWSSTAGHLAGIKDAINEAEKRAGEFFIKKQDQIANALRDLATALAVQRDKLSKDVQAYIDEAKKRDFEMRKLMGGR